MSGAQVEERALDLGTRKLGDMTFHFSWPWLLHLQTGDLSMFLADGVKGKRNQP